jgi:hypothetical protein
MRVANTSTPTRLTCSLNSSAEAVRILSIIGFSLPSPHIHPSLHAVQAQEQVRRGPTSVSEFEVSLADVYKGASIDVRPFPLILLPPLPPSQ